MSRLVRSGSGMLLLLLAAIIAVSVSVSGAPHEDFTKEHATQVAEECKEQTGASDEDLEQMMHHKPSETLEGKCLRACVMKKFGIMDEENKLDKERALELVKAMSKDDAEKEAAGADIVEKCMSIEVHDDHCDMAAALESCIVEQMHEHGLSLDEN